MTRAVVLLAAALLAACAGPPEQEPVLATPGGTGLWWTTERVALDAGRGGAPRPAQVAALLATVAQRSNGHFDNVWLEIEGAGTQAALRDRLEAAGVPARKISVRPGGAYGQVWVALRQARAAPLPCPTLTAAGAEFGPNLRRPGLGCSDMANLANQVVDPLDLYGDQADPVRDAVRPSLAVTRYRAFAPPPSQH